MNKSKLSFALTLALLSTLGMFTGCESADSGSTSPTTNVYYGVGFYDPWYYGHCDDDDTIIVNPPGDRLRPEHPIARPTDASARSRSASTQPTTRPTPSIPSTPRSSGFGGGGGGRGGGRR